ncbi:MAG: hypothetical protein IJW15_03355 [Clostridia bacterium]|nr:hypothetical protein [Clostridia bacterium]
MARQVRGRREVAVATKSPRDFGLAVPCPHSVAAQNLIALKQTNEQSLLQ